MSYVLLFFAINFIISFLSDNILNILSRFSHSPKIIQSLRIYFDNDNFIVTGVYAGLTVMIALLACSLITFMLFKFTFPNTTVELLKYTLLAIPIGYVFDVLIYKYKIFGTLLDPYYKLAGAGFWGMLSFIFSILISYFIMKMM